MNGTVVATFERESGDIDRCDPWDAYPLWRYGEGLALFLLKRGLSLSMIDSIELGESLSEFLTPIEADLIQNGVPRDVAQWWCEQICVEADACEADIG